MSHTYIKIYQIRTSCCVTHTHLSNTHIDTHTHKTHTHTHVSNTQIDTRLSNTHIDDLSNTHIKICQTHTLHIMTYHTRKSCSTTHTHLQTFAFFLCPSLSLSLFSPALSRCVSLCISVFPSLSLCTSYRRNLSFFPFLSHIFFGDIGVPYQNMFRCQVFTHPPNMLRPDRVFL